MGHYCFLHTTGERTFTTVSLFHNSTTSIITANSETVKRFFFRELKVLLFIAIITPTGHLAEAAAKLGTAALLTNKHMHRQQR